MNESVIYLPEVDSTNLWAKHNLDKFGPIGAVYTTHQTAGRGRLGRSWLDAPHKGLYYTAVIRTDLVQPATLPLFASLAVCDALREMLRAARLLNTPVHISHLKAMGPRNWNRRIPEALALLQQARDEGLDVSCDVYPYCAGSTQLLYLLPQDFLAGGTDAVAARLRDPAQRDILRERIAHGRDFDNIAQMVGWDNIRLTTLHRPEFQPLTGKTLAEAARLLGLEPVDCLCHVLAEEACNVTMIDFITCDEDIERILRAPFASVISDSLYPTEGLPHPRVYGTFTRILETFVRERHALTLPEAVQRMTSLPAQALRLQGKGRIAAGMDADVNVFDLAAVHERATWEQPAQESEGMDAVFVGGTPAILHGAFTGAANGQVL